MKTSKQAQQMQEIPIYAMAHVPPFPRKSTSNQLQSSLPPNFVESIRLNSKMNTEGIIDTQFEQTYSRSSPSLSYPSSAPSSYTSSAPSSYTSSSTATSYSSTDSSDSNLDIPRIRRRKKKLSKIRMSTRNRFERFESSSDGDGDADVEKDEDEDESKIISKIKHRKLKKINSSKSLNYHSQLRFQLHSIWILICLIFSMTFFKFQST
ncbi:uncharacterized protein MELLADRAFT_116002 [Melampsora larici-populina 98AG31]|uniref:Uncharacterized protein n=1 Tax=Melampsora larici-populina (strain 98AG31 / pathotype 3-4-7) TaxID=747676 RepID=F4RG52_MELLP|nr:uncharacterized protein MELLADRAFT_116002 [Melampsora larici-populina 98AG31]EGG08548.1 hypothetical protein MELLADRAFT_116002 [Melampsora larici-populina 98AG31]